MSARVLLAVCLALAYPASARAEEPPIREAKRIYLGVALDALYVHAADGDGGIVLRAGVNLSPRLMLELTGGVNPRGPNGEWTSYGGGLRYFLRDGAFAPYLALRAARSHEHPDEGRDTDHLWAAAGPGIAYTSHFGLDWTLDAMPAVARVDDSFATSTHVGLLVSTALGFRFP
jgi:hypothetical protein